MADIGFIVKKIITFFVEPLGLIMSLFLLAIILLFLDKKKLAKIFLVSSFVLLFLFSYPPFSNFLVNNLENTYAKYDYKANVKYIHVLGGGHNTDASQPISSHLCCASTKRVLEGIIIHRNTPDSQLIFTGYAGDTNTSTANMNAELARSLGVDKKSMIINGIPKDTLEEALFTKTIVGEEAFVLVTSATHMPRSILLFESLGMHPIAAPTYFLKDNKSFFSEPDIESFAKSQVAIHEYLGILYSKIKG